MENIDIQSSVFGRLFVQQDSIHMIDRNIRNRQKVPGIEKEEATEDMNEAVVWTEWEYGPLENERPQWEALFVRTVRRVLAVQGVSANVGVEINVVNDETIHEMNRQYREVDRPTDVLSFPLLELEPDTAVQALGQAMPDPDTGVVWLGDMVLSWDHVISQSIEYGHSLEREAAFLIVHSMLHFLGFDHMEPEEEAVMIAEQKKILMELGLSRD